MASTLGHSPFGDRNFWVTEWSARYQGCDRGQSVEAEWQLASNTTDLLLDHLEHGAFAALVYAGYDSYYEHHGAFSYWGQLAFDANSGAYTPRQRFYTNAQVFRFVTPGSRLGFRDPSSGDLTIVGHNTACMYIRRGTPPIWFRAWIRLFRKMGRCSLAWQEMGFLN